MHGCCRLAQRLIASKEILQGSQAGDLPQPVGLESILCDDRDYCVESQGITGELSDPEKNRCELKEEIGAEGRGALKPNSASPLVEK